MHRYTLFFICSLFFGCQESRQKVSHQDTAVGTCNCKSLITVYGNTHLLPRDVQTSYDNENLEDVIKTQKWLYGTISENLVLAEGIPYTGMRFTFDSLLERTGYTNPPPSALEIQKLVQYYNNFEVSFRFIYENQKEVYGGENDSLSNLQRDIAKKYYSSGTLPKSFFQLNDERSKKYAEYAEAICRKNCQCIAIIVGELHLEWFQKNGYKVVYPPRDL